MAHGVPGARAVTGAIWAGLGLVLVFLYAPLVPPAIHSFEGAGGTAGLFRNYTLIFDDARLLRALRTSLLVGLLVALIAPGLALLAAEAVRVWRTPRLIIAVVLLPLFVPGISMGLATGLFFQIVGFQPSLLTITAVQVLWALPFAFLIILTALASFDQAYLEAAYMSGAGRARAFLEVELPQIRQGILGAAVFSLIISFNETIRTAVVQGGRNTVQTYLWSQYQQVGLSPHLFALMTLIIVVTLALIALVALLDRRRAPERDSQAALGMLDRRGSARSLDLTAQGCAFRLVWLDAQVASHWQRRLPRERAAACGHCSRASRSSSSIFAISSYSPAPTT